MPARRTRDERRTEQIRKELAWLALPAVPATVLNGAACKGKPVELFVGYEMSKAPKAGQAICAGCSVLDECRAYAREQPADRLHGLWGGETRRQRNAWRLKHRRVRSYEPRPRRSA